MEHGGNIIFTMYTMEQILKNGSKFLVQYDANTNITLPEDFHDDFVTEAVGSLYKYIHDIINLNLICQ